MSKLAWFPLKQTNEPSSSVSTGVDMSPLLPRTATGLFEQAVLFDTEHSQTFLEPLPPKKLTKPHLALLRPKQENASESLSFSSADSGMLQKLSLFPQPKRPSEVNSKPLYPMPSTSPLQYHTHLGDAVDWLKSLKDESLDLLITDPPYESLEKHRAVGTTTRLKQSKSSSNVWFDIFPNQRFPELFTEVYRVLKKHRHFYLFCDAETMFIAKPLAEAAGFKFWKPLIWDKQKIGMGYHYRARHEYILFFEKGKRRLNNLGIPDVLAFDRIRGGYPTEKPSALLEVLIKQSTEAGELIADPFMGSGSAAVAALANGRQFIGADINPESHELTHTRLTAIGGNANQELKDSHSKLSPLFDR